MNHNAQGGGADVSAAERAAHPDAVHDFRGERRVDGAAAEEEGEEAEEGGAAGDDETRSRDTSGRGTGGDARLATQSF